MSEDDDLGRLLERASAGEPAAFEAIIHRYQARVASVLLHIGVRPQEVQDVLQTVFLRAFRSRRRFRRSGSLAGWLYRIAVNTALDHLREHAVRREVALDPAAEDVAEAHGFGGTGGEGEMELRDLARRALAQLHRLAVRERAVFVLHDVQGLSSRDVARALDIRTPTVRRHLASARAKLRGWLGVPSPFGGKSAPDRDSD